jgi:tetratricopeptide (TPR) repeat protein
MTAPPRKRGLLARLFGGDAPARPAPAVAAPAAAPAPPRELGAPDERWLEELARDVAAGRRAEHIADDTFMGHLATMWDGGRERAVIDWCAKFLGVPAIAPARAQRLRRYMAARHGDRGERDEATPLLEALLGTPPPLADADRAQVHAALAEHARARGDRAAAMRHYEAVLAIDVDFPNARARLGRLRAEDGRRDVAIGETLAAGDLRGVSAGSRYRLVRELGRGATGAVYLARDAELERDVAVKLLHPHLAGADSAEALHLFFREARVMASLRHPNVVAVLDLDQRSRRIVMELAGGGTLRDVLRERGPRPLRRALEHLVQILAALAAAHARGIVHRDLKPANLMFRRDAETLGVEVMLGDFGIANLPDASAATSGSAGPRAPMGTLGYMAPEQRRGGDVTTAADLYALGVVTHEMLTGRLPWAREVMLGGARAPGDLLLPAAALATLPAEVHPPLQALLRGLGEPDPAARPTTAAALAAAQRLREIAMLAQVR